MSFSAESFEWSSRAQVPTDRPERYGKQLASHMGRKVPAQFDEETGTGTIEFGNGAAVAELKAQAATLDMVVRANDIESLARFEQVLGIHLVRFGRKDELACQWVRTSASGETQPGSKQSASDLNQE